MVNIKILIIVIVSPLLQRYKRISFLYEGFRINFIMITNVEVEIVVESHLYRRQLGGLKQAELAKEAGTLSDENLSYGYNSVRPFNVTFIATQG